jgi:hypothetical protein
VGAAVAPPARGHRAVHRRRQSREERRDHRVLVSTMQIGVMHPTPTRTRRTAVPRGPPGVPLWPTPRPPRPSSAPFCAASRSGSSPCGSISPMCSLASTHTRTVAPARPPSVRPRTRGVRVLPLPPRRPPPPLWEVTIPPRGAAGRSMCPWPRVAGVDVVAAVAVVVGADVAGAAVVVVVAAGVVAAHVRRLRQGCRRHRHGRGHRRGLRVG